MLQRNLFYTAITRAKKRVWVLGDASACWTAVENDRVALRYTALEAAVRKEIGVAEEHG
jgi:exodeoxyribonuclease V alpha subunit